jgi:energy-coupling factor transporter ATP-binding protein EcfA2
MKRFQFAVYDVGIDVEIEGAEQVVRLLPTLHALPRGRADPRNWRVRVRAVPLLLPPPRPAVSPTVLHMYPTFDVSCWRDPESRFHAVADRGQVWIDLAHKDAALDYVPGGELDAERLGRLMLLEMLRFEGRYLMHAGAVQVAGGAVLVCGDSGSGKSTLVTAWSALGHARFMAEDRCVLFGKGPILMAAGISDTLALSEHSRQLLESIGVPLPGPRSIQDQKGHYDCHRVFVSVCDDPYPVKAVLIKTQRVASGALFEICEPAEAGELIINSSLYLGSPEIMRAHFEILLALATKVPCFRVPHQVDCREFALRMSEALRRIPAKAVGRPWLDQRRSLPLPRDEAEANGRLLCRILAGPSAPEAPDLQDPSRLFAVLKLADHHGVLSVVAASLVTESVRLPLPSAMADSLAFSLREAGTTRQAHLEAAQIIVNAFGSATIRGALLDGPAVSERGYHPPETRVYDALDWLVEPGQIRDAERVLLDLGFAAAARLPGTGSPAGHGVVLENPATQCRLRLQAAFPTASGRVSARERTRVLLERSVTIRVGAVDLPVIEAGDQLLISCTRSVTHPLWNRLVNLLDITRLQERLSEVALRAVDREAGRCGCRGSFRLGLNRSLGLFAPGQSPDRLADLKPPVLQRLGHAWLNPEAASLRPWGRRQLLRDRLMRWVLP